MQPTTEILERISKDSLTHKEEVFTRLYRYLLRPDIYYQAYQRLYTNKGASTKGINQDTADGFRLYSHSLFRRSCVGYPQLTLCVGKCGLSVCAFVSLP